MAEKFDIRELEKVWPADQPELLAALGDLTTYASSMEGTAGSLVSRPGISYSFRASLPELQGSRERPVYFLVDVVVSEADPWFLSVCFYEDEITDPKDLGNPIPQGLFDETGYCFDLEERDPDLEVYLKVRIKEAFKHAGGRNL